MKNKERKHCLWTTVVSQSLEPLLWICAGHVIKENKSFPYFFFFWKMCILFKRQSLAGVVQKLHNILLWQKIINRIKRRIRKTKAKKNKSFPSFGLMLFLPVRNQVRSKSRSSKNTKSSQKPIMKEDSFCSLIRIISF